MQVAHLDTWVKRLTCFTDVTGPSSAELGIVFVYDIFGYSPQSNQV